MVLLMVSAAGLVPGVWTPFPTHADHPPLAHTGGFGEETCHTCHFDRELNTPGGVLEIEGLPSNYRAGERYSLAVRLKHADLKRGGFMVSARFGSGGQAGMIERDNGRVAVSIADSTNVAYAHHSPTGTEVTAVGAASWMFRWTAPDSSRQGTVYFHAAGNASNNDESAFGDLIYTIERPVLPK